jgi:fatty-acyl-CoA synthase
MGINTINLGHMLNRTAYRYPNRTALVSHEGKSITYQEFDLLSNRFANGLLKLGVKKSTKIGTLSLNCIEQLIAFFGIFKIGCVLVPVNTRLTAPEMADILDHSDTSLLIASKDFEQQVEGFRAKLTGVRSYMVIGPSAASGGHVLDYSQVLEQGGDEYPDVEVLGDEEAVIMYTGGTMGKPKGVILTHQSLIWNCINWEYSDSFRSDDRSLQVFPLYHMAAVGSVLTYIYVGGTMYLKKSFDPKECMETIERERITRWAAAPTVFHMLLQLPGIDKYNTESVTLLGSGASIMPMETRKRLAEVFPNAQMFDNYGMTEANGGIASLRPQDWDRKVASVGTSLIGVAMRVVDDQDQDVKPGVVGEVVFRGNNIMKGYHKDPEGTQEAMKGGWMHTGDLGRLDEEGFLYIEDRKKDLIVTGGENVYPREVEEVLYTYPKVAEAAVIGVPDSMWGEAIKAVIVLSSGDTASEEEIIDYCRGKIARYKCPKSVDFVRELPKTSTGKILKRVLRENYKKRSL